MRLLIILLLFSLAACTENNTYQLNYKTTSNSPIFLYKLDANKPQKVDSSFNQHGEHDFEIDAINPALYLIGESPQKSILFIAKNKAQNEFLITDTNSLKTNVKGDSINIILQSHFNYRSITFERFQNKNKYSENELKQTLESYQNYLKEFISSNRKSPVILMILWEIQNPLNFKNELLFIKDVVELQYKNKFYLEEINKQIQYCKQQEQIITQQQKREAQDITEREKLGINIGAIAPDLAYKDPKGKTRKLKDLRGKVVLLDFWASWCRPCRAENPNVVNLYNKYRKKGFTIYSVSLDKSREQWISAIQQDGLSWGSHVSELNGWNSNAGQKYGVSSIPKTFLIDREGKIQGHNLKGKSLEEKLIELL
jgi:peroxiredoxin